MERYCALARRINKFGVPDKQWLSALNMDEVYNTVQLMRASGDATIRHLYQRTATIVDTRDRIFTPTAQWRFFSGTFIEIETRLFIATVSHSIGNYDSPSRYVLTTKNGRPHPAGASVILRSVPTDDNHPDVGLLELDRELFQLFDGFEAIDISRVSVAPPEQRLASLMGTPAETITIHPIQSHEWGISGTLSGFTTAAIAVDQWPDLNLQKPLDANFDMLVRYPDGSPDIRDDSGMRTTLPEPFGISGGGLWIHDHGNNDFWLPDKCQLVGIQSSWLRDAAYVRLTRIAHWLDLICANYPDLRDALANIDGYSVGESKKPR
ncbi:MAG TPA: hypothetical protein VMY42_24905 [Thermoguttaceae bacterium]|nr:hypothetical protein [Thermoguttaceae bacterium]